MIFVIRTKIKKIEQKFLCYNWGRDAAGKPTYDTKPIGWFVHFEGSSESINFGPEKPAWQDGDEIEITFERVNAQSK